jgi:hypothetical protein
VPSATERKQINQFLGRAGLAQLNEPHALLQQMGTLVQDHDHFRRMLAKCEPEQRYQMYEALAPRLRFPAKTLSEYMIESAQIAEQRQYPTLGEDGQLHPFEVSEIDSRDAETIRKAAEEALSKEKLWLVCRKCTKEHVFSGVTKSDAVCRARGAGWAYDEIRGVGGEICPDCLEKAAPAPETKETKLIKAAQRLRKFTPEDIAAETGIDPREVAGILLRMNRTRG